MNATMFSGVTEGGHANGKVRAATSASSGRSASLAAATSMAIGPYGSGAPGCQMFHWARCSPVFGLSSTTLVTRAR